MNLSNSRILVTGANGFVGKALLQRLHEAGRPIRVALRHSVSNCGASEQTVVGDIGPDTKWQQALKGIDCIVHLAARAHMLDDESSDPLTAYRNINVLGTVRLAQHAVASGVRRLVFLSSIKVNGESTAARPFTEADAPAPLDAYGISKLEAEIALRRISNESGIEIVILRPPLIYGPYVKGNLLRLLNLICRGLPLPLASIKNQRSLLYVANLADAIEYCLDAPVAAGATYMISDGEDISTPLLISKLATAMNKTSRLLPCPPALFLVASRLIGKSAMASRLTGSLTVDSSRIRRELAWQPRYTIDQGLEATAQWYCQARW